MEQWCVDGRQEVRARGHSFVPREEAEQKGFTEDLTEGLRGILVRRDASPPPPPPITTADAVVEGPTTSTPKVYATCAVRCSYYNIAGALVDESGAGDEPLDLVVGAGQVPQGVDELLLTMRAGERLEAWLDPAFGFRDHGMYSAKAHGAGVHAHQPVRVALELVSFENPMTTLQKVARAAQIKEEANALFVAGDIDGALRAYQRALDRIGRSFQLVLSKPEDAAATANGGDRGSNTPGGRTPDEECTRAAEEDRAIRCALLNNIATCWFRREELSRSLIFVNRVLALDPGHPKALFRRAMISGKRLDFDAALGDLRALRASGRGVKEEIDAAIADIERRNCPAPPARMKKQFVSPPSGS